MEFPTKLAMTRAEAVFEMLLSLNSGDCGYIRNGKSPERSLTAERLVADLEDQGIRFEDTPSEDDEEDFGR